MPFIGPMFMKDGETDGTVVRYGPCPYDPVCFSSSSTLGDLVDSFEPTVTQRTDWRTLVHRLLLVDGERCDKVASTPSVLSNATVFSMKPHRQVVECTTRDGDSWL